jgi:Domain of unknown function (DUF3291)
MDHVTLGDALTSRCDADGRQLPQPYDEAMAGYHLAQLNIGRLRAPLDSPQLAGFVAGLDPINALADRSPGFVWRLQTDEGNATSIHAFQDQLLLLNMSVWESPETLRAFVYQSEHRSFLAQRREWFERLAEAIQVLWWVPAGHLPTVEEAVDRLETLRRDGPSPQAFTFRALFPPPSTGGDGDGDGSVDQAEPTPLT